VQSVDLRSFLEKHDKNRIYPRLTDEDRYIAVDPELVQDLRTNSGIVDDSRMHRVV
jgi:hypothetical protein